MTPNILEWLAQLQALEWRRETGWVHNCLLAPDPEYKGLHITPLQHFQREVMGGMVWPNEQNISTHLKVPVTTARLFLQGVVHFSLGCGPGHKVYNPNCDQRQLDPQAQWVYHTLTNACRVVGTTRARG